MFAGNLLCFLHADTHPPHELVNVVRGVMADPNKVLGGFRTIIQTDGRRLHGMTLHHLVKTYYVALLLRPLAFARYIIQCCSQPYTCHACGVCILVHDAVFICLTAMMLLTCIPVYTLSQCFCPCFAPMSPVKMPQKVFPSPREINVCMSQVAWEVAA